MTTPLVLLPEVQRQVFSTQPENDEHLTALAGLATGIVLEYVGPDPLTGLARTWTETTVPDPVRMAILLTVAHLWAHRGDEPETDAGVIRGEPPAAAVRYLHRYREQVVS